MSPGEGILKVTEPYTMVARQGHWVEGNCPARTAELQRDRRKVKGREVPTATPTPAPTVALWRPVRTVV